jgi:hypothetical protein
MSKLFLSDCGELKVSLPDGSTLGNVASNLVVNSGGKVYTFSKAERVQREDQQEQSFLDFVRRMEISLQMRADRKAALRRRRNRRGW